MKSSTLLQSFLLTAGLMVGSIPATQADQAYTIVPSSFLYNLLHDNDDPGLTPWWSSSQYNPGSRHYCKQGKHSPGHHGNPGRGNGYGHTGHWNHGKYDSRGDGHDRRDHWHGKYDGHFDGHKHKGHKQHGKHDARNDSGRKDHRSSARGIGYTGRS